MIAVCGFRIVARVKGRDLLMSTTTPERPARWLHAALSNLNRVMRPASASEIKSFVKLEPIEQILSRAGRDQAESK